MTAVPDDPRHAYARALLAMVEPEYLREVDRAREILAQRDLVCPAHGPVGRKWDGAMRCRVKVGGEDCGQPCRKGDLTYVGAKRKASIDVLASVVVTAERVKSMLGLEPGAPRSVENHVHFTQISVTAEQMAARLGCDVERAREFIVEQGFELLKAKS